MLFKRFLLITIAVFTGTLSFAQTKTIVSSPNKNIQLEFWLNEQGTPMYTLAYKNTAVLLPSSMGFELKQTMSNEALPTLKNNLLLQLLHKPVPIPNGHRFGVM